MRHGFNAWAISCLGQARFDWVTQGRDVGSGRTREAAGDGGTITAGSKIENALGRAGDHQGGKQKRKYAMPAHPGIPEAT